MSPSEKFFAAKFFAAALSIFVFGFFAARAEAKPPRRGGEKFPLRVVIQERGNSVANCVFSTVELPPNAPYSSPQRNAFAAGEPIWGRCFLPSKPGPSRAGDLVDFVSVDGKPAWEQAYDLALPSDAQARLVAYGDVLRSVLAKLAPGGHRVEIVGRLRRGKKNVALYRGGFRYVR